MLLWFNLVFFDLSGKQDSMSVLRAVKCLSEEGSHWRWVGSGKLQHKNSWYLFNSVNKDPDLQLFIALGRYNLFLTQLIEGKEELGWKLVGFWVSGDPVTKGDSQNKYSFLFFCNNDDNRAALFYDFGSLI